MSQRVEGRKLYWKSLNKGLAWGTLLAALYPVSLIGTLDETSLVPDGPVEPRKCVNQTVGPHLVRLLTEGMSPAKQHGEMKRYESTQRDMQQLFRQFTRRAVASYVGTSPSVGVSTLPDPTKNGHMRLGSVYTNRPAIENAVLFAPTADENQPVASQATAVGYSSVLATSAGKQTNTAWLTYDPETKQFDEVSNIQFNQDLTPSIDTKNPVACDTFTLSDLHARESQMNAVAELIAAGPLSAAPLQ